MGVSDSLREVCLHYFMFLWRRWKGENVQINGVLDVLPGPLRGKFAQTTYADLLGKVFMHKVKKVETAQI